jgi:parvulin-like peptidyl-prolyl isomerase
MRRLFTRTALLALLALALAAAVAALAGCGDESKAASSSPSPDKVVLLVDGRPVARDAIDAVRAEFRLGGSPDTEARAEKEAVRRELLRREAERLGVTADPSEVESRRATMVRQAGGEDALTVALQRVSITDAQLRRGLEDGVLHDAVQDAKFGDLAATSAQARAYYDAHPAAFREAGSVHLYAIKVAAERIAATALTRVHEGHPFAEVARQFTQDLDAKAKSGDLGRVALGSLPPMLLKAVRTTPSGSVSRPVKGPDGWYLLKATGLRPAGVTRFDDVEGALVKELTREKRFRALEKWLDGARDKASVTRP